MNRTLTQFENLRRNGSENIRRARLSKNTDYRVKMFKVQRAMASSRDTRSAMGGCVENNLSRPRP